jgi:hypothetical protein
MFLGAIFSVPAHAFYQKRVLVGEFINPIKWEKPYYPNDIIIKLLRQELMSGKRVQLISKPESSGQSIKKLNPKYSQGSLESDTFDSREKSLPDTEFISNPASQQKTNQNDILISQEDQVDLWPIKFGEKTQKANFTEIRVKIIKFIPNKSQSGELSNFLKNRVNENSVIQVHIELLQNSTGKILFEKMFEIFSSSGTQPFNINNLNLTNMDIIPSSLNFALKTLKKQMLLFVNESLDSIPLEGEILATKRKNILSKKGENINFEEEILVNIGSLNGVQIGDLFQVDAVGLGLNDLYTKRGLGDVYVRIGVIQITDVWKGTAKAIALAGKNFEKGHLVRSIATIKNK